MELRKKKKTSSRQAEIDSRDFYEYDESRSVLAEANLSGRCCMLSLRLYTVTLLCAFYAQWQFMHAQPGTNVGRTSKREGEAREREREGGNLL